MKGLIEFQSANESEFKGEIHGADAMPVNVSNGLDIPAVKPLKVLVIGLGMVEEAVIELSAATCPGGPEGTGM